jgi:hypothetical protein
MNSHGFPFKLSACAIAVLISACGGGSSTAPILVPGSTGFAVDDYIKDANVLCDTNGNGVSDTGETTTKTDSSGFFKFQPLCASTIVVSGGTNIDTGLPFIGKLKAPAGATVVTPLTTLLAEGMSNDQIITAMGLPAGTNVLAVDPARKVDGLLEQAALFKKTLAMQQLLQKTAETLAALIPGGDASALYADVAAAMAASLRTNPNLISGGVFSQSAIASLVQASATRLQSSLGAGVNAASLGAVVAGALKVQGDRILGASDSTLTATVLTEQSSAAIKNFVNTNKSALGSPPSVTTDTLGSQLTQEVTGNEPPPPAPPVEPPAGSSSLASFDEATLPMVTEFGGAGYAIGSGPDGGSGKSLKIARNGGETYAGAWVKIPAIAANTGSRTIWARVYSPTAVDKFTAKVEFGDNTGSGEIQANEAVVMGWQTLTWTVNTNAFDATKVYDRFTILPNLTKVDTLKDYYIDSISLLAPPPAACSTSSLQCLAFSESTVGVSGFEGLVSAEIVNDPTNASNKVVKLVKGPSGQAWAGATVRTSRTGEGTQGNPYVDTIDRIGLPTSKTVTLKSYSGAAVGTKITLKLENGLDATKFVIAEAVTTKQNEWETLTFNFANLTLGSYDENVTYNKASIFPAFSEVQNTQAKPTVDTTFYFDELKYSVYTAPDSAIEPTTAPTTVIPADAAVIYSDAASVAGLDAAPNWSQNPPVVSSEPTIANNKSRKYVFSAGALYQGLDWAASPQNVTTKGKLHLDFFSPDITSVKVTIISVGGGGDGQAVTKAITAGSWNSIDIDLSEFPAADKSKIFQIKVEPNVAGTLFVDNIYFWGTSGGGSSGGEALTFSSGFSSAVLTASNGVILSSGGSNQDDFNCNGTVGWCGSFSGGTGADSYAGFYYQTPSAASALYSQMEVFGPNVTGFNASGDTGGITLTNQTKVNFTFNQNAQWFGSSNNKFGVIITLGKRYAIDGGCRLQLHGVKTPTSVDATAYSMNLRNDFRVAADCGAGIPPTDVAAALAASPVISSVKFIGAAGGSTIYGRDNVASGANLSTANGDGAYPTTVVLKGAITFD